MTGKPGKDADGSKGIRPDRMFERAGELLRARPGVTLIAIGFALFWLSYTGVLMLAQPETGLAAQLAGGLNNAVSAVLVGATLMVMLRLVVIGRPSWVQTLAHITLAPACALIWYLAVIAGIGLRSGSLTEGFSVNPFPPGAISWQVFQGFFLYVAVTGASYAIVFYQRAVAAEASLDAAQAAAPSSAAIAEPQRLMVRDGAGMTNIDLTDIILCIAADDYVEVVTPHKRYLARQTMTRLMDGLPDRFVRVHRSKAVNLDHVVTAEPAGDGRLTLYLDGGHTLTTSRSGARAIKERTAGA